MERRGFLRALIVAPLITRFAPAGEIGVAPRSYDNLYGDGRDGHLVVTGAVELTRDCYFETLHIKIGGILKTNGYRASVRRWARLQGPIMS